MFLYSLIIILFTSLFLQDQRASVLFSVVDANTQLHITTVDSIRVMTAYNAFTIANAKAPLNFTIKDLHPGSCLITVYLAGYHPAGQRLELKAGKRKTFTLSIKKITTPVDDRSTIYREAPAYPGGELRLNCFLNEYLDLDIVSNSDLEKKNVLVSFLVQANGSITELVLKEKHSSEAVNEEILRIFKRMPAWDPAVRNRQPIARNCEVAIKIPYDFLECK